MMWLSHFIWTRNNITTVCVGLTALLGDHLVSLDALSLDLRAVIDNLTHCIIGLLTWCIVITHLTNSTLNSHLYEIVLCGLFASAVDLDHFVAARSFKIEDARQLSSRPPMHCTSVMMAVCNLALLLAHLFHLHLLQRVSWILAAAVLSHHLRDACRHGLWLYPFGSSPPVPYAVYIVGSMLLPHALPWLVRWTQVTQPAAPLHRVVAL